MSNQFTLTFNGETKSFDSAAEMAAWLELQNNTKKQQNKRFKKNKKTKPKPSKGILDFKKSNHSK